MVYEFQFHLSMHFQDLHPILAGEADNIPGRRVSMRNEYHLIHYIRRGCGTVYTDRGTFHAHAGQIIYIRPGESISFLADMEDPWAYRWMGFDGVLSHRFSILPTIFDAPPGTFDDLCDIRDQETQVVEYKLLSELYFLFSKLLPPEDKMPPNYTQQIIDHIQTHYMEPLTVSGIADGFRFTLDGTGGGIQIFPEAYGISIMNLPFGGFLTLGLLIGLMQAALKKSEKKKKSAERAAKEAALQKEVEE